MTTSVYDQALSPISFLLRSAEVWSDRPAVQDGDEVVDFQVHLAKIERAKGALTGAYGIRPGDRVAALLPNSPTLLELNYAVPGSDAVLVPMNTRLAPDDYAYILDHSGTSLVVADAVYRDVLGRSLEALGSRAPMVAWTSGDQDEWAEAIKSSTALGLSRPVDERSLLSINYTSGTTARPKGVMTTHRGAYLHSLGVIAEANLTVSSAYLWTLPMFHCNGWAYMWAVTAAGAKHVCMRQVIPSAAWQALISDGITHLCAAPTVVVMLLEDLHARRLDHPVSLFVGGAPPPPALLQRAAELNISVTHLYGLTETYGPIAVCAWNPIWDQLPSDEQAALRARQGVATLVSERLRIVDSEMADVPADGESVGEIVMRGNNVMVGYYRDSDATANAFRGGWFHSGDVGVMHPDHRIEIRDRLKDVIISGGENISSVEVEAVLSAYPGVAEAAVVGDTDMTWGEVVVAFVVPRGGAQLDRDDLTSFAQAKLARFKVPKRVYVIDQLPKTGTGKIQKYVLRQQLSSGHERGSGQMLFFDKGTGN
jgi:fatty-acyl-CoA synthase